MKEEMSEVNSMDLVIELYKKDVDRTLLTENLKRTAEERFRALEEFEEFREAMQAAMKAAKAKAVK